MKYNIIEIVKNISDENILNHIMCDFFDYINSGSESSYNNVLLKLGYDIPIHTISSKNLCHNCSDLSLRHSVAGENFYLIYDQQNNYYICENCYNITYTFDFNPERIKKYHFNPYKKIFNNLKYFNYSLPETEQLTNEEIERLMKIYIDVKNIVGNVTDRKYNFKYKFFLSRLMIIINKNNINKYITFSLSKSTYNKYLSQWSLICKYMNIPFDGMSDIKINKYIYK